jgi:two-component system phosphate regulon sensor histidine kinase PhoR
MLPRLRQIGTKVRLTSVLVLVVILPALFYSVYEFTTLTRSEELIAGVYRQQLDVVLYSLNQYSWDVVNSWANTINDALSVKAITERERASLIEEFLRENSGIRSLFISPVVEVRPRVYSAASSSDTGSEVSVRQVAAMLRERSEMLGRLEELLASGYRKIEPIFIDGRTGQRSLALVFVAGGRRDTRQVAGFVVDEERFIHRVLAQKMDEAAGDNFLLAVHRKGMERPIYATGEMGRSGFRQTKDLWLFSDYDLGIRLKGETIEEVVQSRFYRNLILIGLLNVVLLGGVWVVYRTVLREVELAQMKSDFVSNVSHEIRTPLALIRMFGETLQLNRVRSAAKRQEYYDTIVQESERLTRLVNNLLDFSRMEAGMKTFDLQPSDLNALVRGVVKNYAARLEQEGVSVRLELDPQLPPIALDKEAVSEAILNLVDNAVKYSGGAKFLRLSTGVERTTVTLDIEDHGIGIEPHQQRKIFEKFYRVSSGPTHEATGTGLGLTLVKHIVDAHKGTISLRSEKGKGSIFRLTFPIPGHHRD